MARDMTGKVVKVPVVSLVGDDGILEKHLRRDDYYTLIQQKV